MFKTSHLGAAGLYHQENIYHANLSSHSNNEEFTYFEESSWQIRKDGIVYPSAEHFFQAHKTLDLAQRRQVAEAGQLDLAKILQVLSARYESAGTKVQARLATSGSYRGGSFPHPS